MKQRLDFPVQCPVCGKVSDSIKLYKLPDFYLFLLIVAYARNKNYIGCPSCMRKEILRSGFTYNIVSGNLFWLIGILPWSIINLLRTYTKGHSKEIPDLIDYGK